MIETIFFLFIICCLLVMLPYIIAYALLFLGLVGMALGLIWGAFARMFQSRK